MQGEHFTIMLCDVLCHVPAFMCCVIMCLLCDNVAVSCACCVIAGCVMYLLCHHVAVSCACCVIM